MATSVGALYYDLTVDDSGVDAGLNRADSKLAGFQNKLQKVGEGMTNAGKKMTMGLTLPIVGLGIAGVKMASDLNETVNKVNVAFGESANKVQEWGNTTLKSLGLAKGSALDAAALFGDMATSMGLPQQAAADMSMKMVGLGADLASFKNISFEEAQTALAGVFTGETESLKRLGVVMTQTQLDAFALAQGLGKTTSEMSQAELVNLRYAFVMDKTKNAQGDFARTSDGTANQLRIMQETFKETSATIGQNLLPIVTKIAGKVAEWTKKFAELSPQTQKVILIIAAVVAVMGPLLIVIGQLIMAIRAISMAFAFLGANPIVLAVVAI
ncbi:MAG: phage tail tape measure protein, partial [Candidatus Paceibacterota bacterium]